MADFFQTSFVKRPIATPYPDVFVRRDIKPATFNAIREKANALEAAGEDASEDDAFELLWDMFQHFICDADGNPFENTREQVRDGTNALLAKEFAGMIFEALASVGKPTSKRRVRK